MDQPYPAATRVALSCLVLALVAGLFLGLAAIAAALLVAAAG